MHPVSVCITTFLHACLSFHISFISVFCRLYALFISLASVSNSMCLPVSLHLSSHLSLCVCGAYSSVSLVSISPAYSLFLSHKHHSFYVSALSSALQQ